MSQEAEPVTEDPKEESPRPSPGRELRMARETRELSVQQVANELHLTMHYVNALEADDFERLPGDVFVKGYLRSYALLLQLDPDEILHYYRQAGERRLARKEEAIDRYSRRRKDRNRPWVIISSVAFVVLALLLWYLNGSADSVPPAADTGRESGPVQRALESPVLSSAVHALSGQQASMDGADSSAATDSGATAEEAPVLPAVAARTLAWGGPDTLQLMLGTESRVRVRETGDQHNSEENMKRGELLRVDGTAPFDVVIDHASGAIVTFNGRQVDVDEIVRDDGSARLTIGF